MPIVHLKERAILEVAGAEAEHFLQNLITTDLGALAKGEAKPGALLTPQGKIMFDFLISRSGDERFLIDVSAGAADELAKRLTLYKLRAKVTIAKQEQLLVHAAWEEESGASQSDSSWLADARFAGGFVRRAYLAALVDEGDVAEWHRLRVTNGIAECGLDFDPSDAFPHDVALDQLAGVGMRKGCYVGQEVVSRMHHRGTARRRVMIATGAGNLTARAPVTAGERNIGALGSASGNTAIAIVRLDRVASAGNSEIKAGDVSVELALPTWAGYRLPEPSDSANTGE
jgi:tRNA-modifying protein YgfZ